MTLSKKSKTFSFLLASNQSTPTITVCVFNSCCRNQVAVKLEWKWMDEDASNQELDRMEPIDRFYVFEGRQIFDFFNAILLKSTMPICQLESYKTAVYKLPHTNSVICLTEGNELNRTAQITEMLRPWINAAKETFAFAFQPTYSYYSERNFDRMCFVRSICGNRPVDTTKLDFVEPMEDSNMISGVSAGGIFCTHTIQSSISPDLTHFYVLSRIFTTVSTYCHMHEIPVSCYAIYIDCPTIDAVVSPLIIRLLNEIGLETEPVYVFKKLSTSNLYIWIRLNKNGPRIYSLIFHSNVENKSRLFIVWAAASRTDKFTKIRAESTIRSDDKLFLQNKIVTGTLILSHTS